MSGDPIITVRDLTIGWGDFILMRDVAFEIQRGDIIIFASRDDPRKDLIKRVVGLPGEQVEVIDGTVYVNDRKIHEDYVLEFKHHRGERYGPEVIPEGRYFVLGDNRPESQDSRVFDGPPHGAGRILAMCDRYDATSADQTERRLYADDAVDAGRAND